MIRHRSRLPLVLVLAFALGLVVLWQGSNRSPGTSSRADVSPTRENLEPMPEGFGPIPRASAPDDVPAVAPRSKGEGTSGEMRELAARMSRETGDLKVVTHPDGRRSVSLEGRFLHMSAVVTGADGKPEVRCFTDFQQMAAALPGGPPAESPRPATHAR